MNLNITIIIGTMIKYPHDSWNPRTGFGSRGTGFKVRFWRLAVPLYWWLSWFINTKGVLLFNNFYKNLWEEFRDMYDKGITLVSNYSTAFVNSLLFSAERCNNWLESCCIIFEGRLRTKMMRVWKWSGQGSWVSNHFQTTIYSINVSPCIDSLFCDVVE